MPGLQIRCLILPLVVLAVHALEENALEKEKPEYACKCLDLTDDLCQFLKEQNVIVTTNEEQVKKYGDIIHQSEMFLKNAEKRITRVVNILVDQHINSVLKNALADGTPTANPEDSDESSEMLDTDLGLERTHDYLTLLFKAMKDFSSEFKATANPTRNPRVDEEDAEKRWSDEGKQLLQRLDELKTSSSASKDDLSSKIRQLEETNSGLRQELSDLRSQISPRLKEMEDKLNLYENITVFEKALFDIGRGKQNDSETLPIGENCTDRTYPGYCEQIVLAKFCSRKYYRGICCASCTKAEQLPSD